jgi:membrane-associated phospholipid phosphatase
MAGLAFRTALLILLAGALIALVVFSGTYLGAHQLSDVLGTIAEG